MTFNVNKHKWKKRILNNKINFMALINQFINTENKVKHNFEIKYSGKYHFYTMPYISVFVRK